MSSFGFRHRQTNSWFNGELSIPPLTFPFFSPCPHLSPFQIYFYCLYPLEPCVFHMAASQAVLMCRISYIMALVFLSTVKGSCVILGVRIGVRSPCLSGFLAGTNLDYSYKMVVFLFFFCTCCKVSKKKDLSHHVITCVLWD